MTHLKKFLNLDGNVMSCIANLQLLSKDTLDKTLHWMAVNVYVYKNLHINKETFAFQYFHIAFFFVNIENSLWCTIFQIKTWLCTNFHKNYWLFSPKNSFIDVAQIFKCTFLSDPGLGDSLYCSVKLNQRVLFLQPSKDFLPFSYTCGWFTNLTLRW